MPEGRSDNGSARARGAKDREAPLPFLLAVLGWTPRDAVAFVVGIVAVVAILVNSLSLQSGSHPAPLFEPAEVEKTVQAAAKPTKPRPGIAPSGRSWGAVPGVAEPRLIFLDTFSKRDAPLPFSVPRAHFAPALDPCIVRITNRLQVHGRVGAMEFIGALN
jgi:hypothetical protein